MAKHAFVDQMGPNIEKAKLHGILGYIHRKRAIFTHAVGGVPRATCG